MNTGIPLAREGRSKWSRPSNLTPIGRSPRPATWLRHPDPQLRAIAVEVRATKRGVVVEPSWDIPRSPVGTWDEAMDLARRLLDGWSTATWEPCDECPRLTVAYGRRLVGEGGF